MSDHRQAPWLLPGAREILARLPATRRAALANAPVAACLTALIGLALGKWLAPPDWPAIGIGALGWTVALALRQPVAVITQRRRADRTGLNLALVAASGPAEESVRVAVVLILAASFRSALWVGFGWASIEIVYTVINALTVMSLLPKLMQRDDAKARQALRSLDAVGTFNLVRSAPVAAIAYGVAERLGASAIHVGFTLLLAMQPLLVFATIPVHTSTNLTFVELAQRSLLATAAIILAVGAAVFVAALAFTHHL